MQNWSEPHNESRRKSEDRSSCWEKDRKFSGDLRWGGESEQRKQNPCCWGLAWPQWQQCPPCSYCCCWMIQNKTNSNPYQIPSNSKQLQLQLQGIPLITKTLTQSSILKFNNNHSLLSLPPKSRPTHCGCCVWRGSSIQFIDH